MTDWLVYLSPLLLLPIVMLFGFVGCTLNTKGSPAATVALVIGKGMDTGVESVLVEFQYRLKPSNEAASNMFLTFTLTSSDLTEGSVFDKTDELQLWDAPFGHLECTCEVTETATSKKTPLFYNQSYNRENEDSGLDPFKLSREDGEFTLTSTWVDQV